ncbi:MAG: hypothetical protein EA360_05325 [Balneolaceae bacterium]|nr:MAG: hypothetical protein EA360_05325 [Balneolaceae bacterium]
MSKKLSREDLEQDLLIEYSSRIVYFYNQNKAVVLGGGTAVVLTIALVIGFIFYSAQQEREAQVLLGTAEQYMMIGDFDRALYGDEDSFSLGFVQIARNYSRTSSGNLARYYASVAEFELGNYETSLEFIQQFTPPPGILGVAPLMMHAIILTELDRFEEAATAFERAAEWDINNSTTPKGLFEAALAHRKTGNSHQAMNLLNRILTEFPNSQQAVNAERLRGQLAAAGRP